MAPEAVLWVKEPTIRQEREVVSGLGISQESQDVGKRALPAALFSDYRNQPGIQWE